MTGNPNTHRDPASAGPSAGPSHIKFATWNLVFGIVLGFGIGCFGLLPRANAQRAFSVAITPTNQNRIAISWKAQSATPIGDLVILPQFRVHRTLDFKTWIPVSGLLSGSLGQTMSLSDSNSNIGIYRVESVISEEYAELNNAKLSFGQLAGADFFGARLFGTSLDQADLAHSSFVGADLRFANLRGASLIGADLFNIQAASTDLTSANLAGADASYADFENASFNNSDLTRVDFSFSVLSGADLSFASFFGTKLDSDTLIDDNPKLVWQIVNEGAAGAILTNKDISLATLTNANLNGAKLNGSDLFGDDLRSADIRGANFTSARMSFVDFRGTLLDATTVLDSKSRLAWLIINQPTSGRDLHGTNLSSIFLFQANLINANLTNSVCTNSFFEQANFTGANLAKGTFTGSDFIEANLGNAILTNALGSAAFFEFVNLGRANLVRGTFTGADFIGASITNADLTLAGFRFTDLTDASLRNSVTNGADFSGAVFHNTVMPDGSIRNF